MDCKHLKELFSQGKHEAVLADLKKEVKDKELQKEIYLIANRYVIAMRGTSMGIVDNTQNGYELNRILNSIWDTICKIEEFETNLRHTEVKDYDFIAKEIKKNQGKNTSELLKGKKVDDLDHKELQNFLNIERVTKKLIEQDEDLLTKNNYEKLCALSLALDECLFKGVVLSFGKSNTIPFICESASATNFLIFKGKNREKLFFEEKINGNLIQQYTKVIELFRRKIDLIRDTYKNEEDYEIPFVVFRELVANAFIHRDYNSKTHIKTSIEFFDDRLEIKNPSKSKLDLNDCTIDYSIPVNPTIAGIFYLYAFAEEIGSGILRTQNELERCNMQKAKFSYDENIIKVVVYKNRKDKTENSIPHHLTNNIPTNVEHILGRETELATITSHLAQHKSTILVNGIGGIGKTSVAEKYMALNGQEYKHLAWLTVQNSLSETFTSDMLLLNSLQIADEVHLLIKAQKIAEAFQLVFHKLNSLDSTLVVVDNANDLADLVQYKKLFDTAHCHFLLTSRTLPQAWQVVKIEKLSTDEALALFRLNAPSVQASDKDLTALLGCLDFHTLLIELIAKSAYASAIPFETLQQIIQDNFIHDKMLNKRKVNTGTHGDSLEDNSKRAKVEEYIWFIFHNIAEIPELTKILLKGMALLPLANTFTDDFLETHFKHFVLEEDIFELLDYLVERGWLESVRQTEKPAYKMHPLIADVVVKYLDVDVSFAEAYILHVANLIDYDDTNPDHNLFKIKEYIPFSERLSDLFFEQYTEEMSELLDNLGNLEDSLGFYNKAVKLKERALQMAETLFDTDNITVITRQSNLALAYINLGNYNRAGILLESALANDLKNFNPEHPSIAIYQSNLATVYQGLGQYERAATLLETALASDLKNYGSEHPLVAVRQSNLGNVYRNLRQYEHAATLLESALASDLKNFGAEHPNVALCQWSLAANYIDLGRKKEAQVLLQLAYQNFLKNLGAEHPNTIKLKEWAEG